jgi:hypothetical protein
LPADDCARRYTRRNSARGRTPARSDPPRVTI